MTEGVVYASEFVGGPYDGVIVFLIRPFAEVLHPRGDAAGKELHPDEASFNMSMTGHPFSPGVTYDRYHVTERCVIKQVQLPSGQVVPNTHVRIYEYTGVVSGHTEPGDPTIM